MQKFKISEILKNKPIIYVSKEPDKGLGFPEPIPGFFIITPQDKIFPDLKVKFKNSIILSKTTGSTRAILADTDILKKIKSLSASILVFKNTPSIVKITHDHKIKILNNPPEFSKNFEEKINQFNWFKNFKKYLPPESAIKMVKYIKWQGEPILLQWNTGHSGNGTVLIENKNTLDDLKDKFPNREARISQKINGFTFTNNNVVFENQIKIGNLSFQITGLYPFTTNQFSTIGNDFSLSEKILSTEDIKDYKKICLEISQKLQKENYRGVFGLDMIFEPKTQKWFLIEINTRQTSSTTLESWLQIQNDTNLDQTIFANHLFALLKISPPDNLTKINRGGQLILRNQTDKSFNLQKIKRELEKTIKPIFIYENTKENEEILRIWTNENILETPEKFTQLGQKIVETIKNHSLTSKFHSKANQSQKPLL